MNTLLKLRIQKIAAPNVVELDLKRNARFGKLNIAPSFDLTAQIRSSEARGDIRKQFARMASNAGIREGVGL